MGNKNDKKEKSAKQKKIDATIIVALIGAITTIIVALISRPPSSPTATPVSPSPLPPTNTTQPETVTPSPTFTEAFTLTFTPTESLTPTFTFTPNSDLPIGMQVKVTADPSRGRPPLTVRLDARDSYLRAPNGDIFECRNGACKYTWYLTVTGGQPEELDSKSGFIQLTFDRRGTYYINVYVCHGSDNPTCNSGGAIVIVE